MYVSSRSQPTSSTTAAQQLLRAVVVDERRLQRRADLHVPLDRHLVLRRQRDRSRRTPPRSSPGRARRARACSGAARARSAARRRAARAGPPRRIPDRSTRCSCQSSQVVVQTIGARRRRSRRDPLGRLFLPALDPLDGPPAEQARPEKPPCPRLAEDRRIPPAELAERARTVANSRRSGIVLWPAKSSRSRRLARRAIRRSPSASLQPVLVLVDEPQLHLGELLDHVDLLDVARRS